MYNTEIGIIGAMESEVEEFATTLTDVQRVKYGGIEFILGKRSAKSVVLCRCGIGKVNSAVAATLMIDKFPSVKLIINIGVAGGSKAGIKQCDFVVSSKTVYHDFDSTADGLALGQVPANEFVFFESELSYGEKLLKVLEELNFTAYRGVIGSGDQFVADGKRVEFIVKNFDAYAVDMESAAINHVCYLFNKPFVSLRCISDKADGEGVKSFYEFLSEATHKTAQAIGLFIDTVNFE